MEATAQPVSVNGITHKYGGRTPQNSQQTRRSTAAPQLHRKPQSYAGAANHSNKQVCYRCGNPGHIARECRCSVGVMCQKCHRLGHFTRMCRSQTASATDTRRQGTQRQDKRQANLTHKKQVNYVNTETPCSSDEEIFSLSCDAGSPKIEVLIKGQPVAMLIDSGASCNIISSKEWKLLKTQRTANLKPVNKNIFPY